MMFALAVAGIVSVGTRNQARRDHHAGKQSGYSQSF